MSRKRAVIKQPEHPAGPAFDKARGWAEQQERSLTEQQSRVYEDLKKQQAIQKSQQQQRLDAFRAQLEEQAKKKKPLAELVLNPPVKTADPHIRSQTQNIMAAEKRLEQLDHSHANERTKLLQAFEQERERQQSRPARELTASWRDALQKSAQQEADRGRDRSRDLTRDFDKSR